MTAKVSEEEEQKTTLVSLILDKVESSADNWRRGSMGNRTFSIHQEEYDAVGKWELIEEVKELERNVSICFKGKWYSYSSELEAVSYRLQDLPVLYELADRTPKAESIEALEAEVKVLMDGKEIRQWIRRCLEELLRQLSEGVIPKEYCLDSENIKKRKLVYSFLKQRDLLKRKEWYLKTLSALNETEEPIYRRVFSKRVLGDSKLFEKKVQSLIIASARRFHPDVDTDKEVMSDSEVLSQLLIETYDQELLIKGPLHLRICGKEADFSVFPFGAVLNGETMEAADILPEQNFKRVLTVENKANFMKMPYEEDTLLIFTHGFLSPKERKFLCRLRDSLSGIGKMNSHGSDLENVKKRQEVCCGYFHFGDLDYGGIRIYQYIKEKVFPELQPYRMNAEEFEKHREDIILKEEDYLKKVGNMSVPPELEEMRQCILSFGGIIEQESLI